MTVGSIWDAFWGAFGVIFWVQNASKKYVSFSKYFACCLARGLEAPRREVAGGVEGNWPVFGLRGRIQEGEAKVLGTWLLRIPVLNAES